MLLQRCLNCQFLLRGANLQSVRTISLAAGKLKHIASTRAALKRPSVDGDKDSTVRILPHTDNSYDDAYLIANKALALLRKGNDAAVMKLIRQNHDLDLTVTWNYVIRWRIDQGRLGGAFNAFQHMKKRQHFPNAYTYTILLNGLYQDYEKMQRGHDKLEYLVDTLLKDKRVTPSVIHFNAILKVCSKDSLKLVYRMLDRLQQVDSDMLDGITYDTIFRTIDKAIDRESNDTTNPHNTQLNDAALKHLQDARNIWKDVEARSAAGKLNVDSRLIDSYVSVLFRGGSPYAKEGISVIVEYCGLPLYEADSASSEALVRDKDIRRHRIVKLEAELLLKLLDFARLCHDPQLADHYWQYAKAHASGTFDQHIYHARLRSLIDARAPDAASKLLEEMDEHKIEITERTMFLALQSQLTRKADDLARAVTFLKTRKETSRLLSYEIVTTLSRIVKVHDSNSDGGMALVGAVNILRHADLPALFASITKDSRKKDFLLSCVNFLMIKCRVERGRRASVLRKARGDNTLSDELVYVNNSDKLRTFINRLTMFREKFYPENLPDRERAAKGTDRNVPDAHLAMPVQTHRAARLH